jgi:hypothetical protein
MSTIALLFALSAVNESCCRPGHHRGHRSHLPRLRRWPAGGRPAARRPLPAPGLAKRAVLGDTPDERLGLRRRMSKEELVSLTKQGALKTPKDQWDRRCTVLDVTGNAASVRWKRRGSSITSTWGASTSAGHRQRVVVPETEGEVSDACRR